MTETNIDILGGHSQIVPSATQAVQINNNYGSPVPLPEPSSARTVVAANLADWLE